MPGVLIDDLRQCLESKQALVIVGAGASLATTGGHELASWRGLLRAGAQRCQDLFGAQLRNDWLDSAIKDIDSNDVDDLMLAAERVSRKLGSPSGGEFARWLQETVGSLPLKNDALANAISRLGVPVVTTNYDDLIERALGISGYTWMDRQAVERIVTGKERAILHLHGIWSNPRSVVLGIQSYAEILGDSHAQAVLQAVAALRTIVFVGFGAGLEDPNFGALLSWFRSTFPNSSHRHFRLEREADVSTVSDLHRGDPRMFVVPYGEDFSDLAPFLTTLVQPARDVKRSVQEPDASVSLPPSLPRVTAPLRCFGREAEIGQVVAALTVGQPRPVPVLGAPGIGKSTICSGAMAVPSVIERFGQRRLFVRCDTLTSPRGILSDIGTQLGLPLGADLEARTLADLAHHPTLICLDNFESIWETDVTASEEMLTNLASIESVALVASIRGTQRPFGIDWTAAIRVPPLDTLSANELFLSIAGQQFATDPHLVQLLSGLEGVPLAIELLAYNAEGEPSLEGIWARWREERTNLLKREGTGRLSSLAVSLELSWKSARMTPDARRLLSCLALLPDGIRQNGISSIAPSVNSSAPGILRKNGLAFDEESRLRVLAPIRDYVVEHHPPRENELNRAHSYFAKLARRLGPRIGRNKGGDAADELRQEFKNIEALLGKGLLSRHSKDVAEILFGVSAFSRFSGVGSPDTAEKEFLHVLANGRTAALTWVQLELGGLFANRGQVAQAERHFSEAHAGFRHLTIAEGEVNSLVGLGQLALLKGDVKSARDYYVAASELAKSDGFDAGTANAAHGLAKIAWETGHVAEAEARTLEAIALYEGAKDALGTANCLSTLASIDLFRDDANRAEGRFSSAGLIYKDVGDKLGEAAVLHGLARVSKSRANYAEAFRYCHEAFIVAEAAGIGPTQANILITRADICCLTGDVEDAKSFIAQAREIVARTPAARLERTITCMDAERAIQIGDLITAWELLDRCLLNLDAENDRSIIAECSRLAAIAHLVGGNLEECLKQCHRAKEVDREMTDDAEVVAVDLVIAQALVDAGRVQEARRVLTDSRLESDAEARPYLRSARLLLIITAEIVAGEVERAKSSLGRLGGSAADDVPVLRCQHLLVQCELAAQAEDITADELSRRAMEAALTSRNEYWIGQAQLRAAAALSRLRPNFSAATARAAADTFRRLGNVSLEQKAIRLAT